MSSELKKFKNKKGSAQSPAYRMTISCIVTDSENNESAIRGIRSATECALIFRNG